MRSPHLPESTRTGARRWRDPVIDELHQRLWYGDPTLGWEGDTGLALFEGKSGRTYELWRVDEQGRDHLVARGPKSRAMLFQLIPGLVENDTRRGSAERIERALEAEAKQRADAEDERIGQAVDAYLTAATTHKGVKPQRLS